MEREAWAAAAVRSAVAIQLQALNAEIVRGDAQVAALVRFVTVEEATGNPAPAHEALFPDALDAGDRRTRRDRGHLEDDAGPSGETY
jgi:hypothetical protein